MHMHNPVSSRRDALARYCVGLLALVGALSMVGCTGAEPLDTAVLQAQQEIPGRVPVAGQVDISVYNESDFTADVVVDCYIGSVLVHHSVAVLAPVSSSDPNTALFLDGDEADRVVVSVQVRDSAGTAVWSDQKTYLLGSDFVDADFIEYSIVYSNGPSASVTAPASVPARALVTLDASGSVSSGGPLSFAWTQVSGPAVTLSAPAGVTTSFTAPVVASPTSLVFQLIVTDSQGQASDVVVVTVQPNQGPVAMATGPTSASAGSTVTLSGSGSYDPDGDPLTYLWEQISGMPVVLSSTDQPDVSFTAPPVSVSETLVFRLTASDGLASSARQVNVVVLGGFFVVTAP